MSMDFAVWHDGLPEGKARWVLAVDTNRFLLSDDEAGFYWKPMSDCKFVRLAGPDQPRPVVAIQPTPQVAVPQNGNGLHLPKGY